LKEENKEKPEVHIDLSGILRDVLNDQKQYFAMQHYISHRRLYGEIVINFISTMSIKDQNILLRNLKENSRICEALCKKYHLVQEDETNGVN